MDLRRYTPLRAAGATWKEIAAEVGCCRTYQMTTGASLALMTGGGSVERRRRQVAPGWSRCRDVRAPLQRLVGEAVRWLSRR
jgi:hypothetical protein